MTIFELLTPSTESSKGRQVVKEHAMTIVELLTPSSTR